MKLEFTKRSQKNYFAIKDYLTDEWGQNVTKAFEQKVKDFFDLLKRFPELVNKEVTHKQNCVLANSIEFN